jgi:nucleotide-binding universal stress UspA family protein
MPYKKILAGTDGSPTAKLALQAAARIAKTGGAEMIIVCVFDPPTQSQLHDQILSAPSDEHWRITGAAAAEEIVDKAVSMIADVGVEAKGRIEVGDPAEMILSVAEEESCDLVVVGNKGMKGIKRFLLGSVPNRVSHHSPCDVMIVKTT